MPQALGKFDGDIEVCAHRVTFRYWDFNTPLDPDLEQRLTEEAEERAKHCIIKGFQSGELNCLVVTDDGEEEVRGWWEIAGRP